MRKTTTGTGSKHNALTKEHERLLEHGQNKKNWKHWGPYVSDRAWGTVREDYSSDGSAWKTPLTICSPMVASKGTISAAYSAGIRTFSREARM